MPRQSSGPDLIAQIRRAAFDLRDENPPKAAQALRRLLKDAGPAEPLVRGALGEILLEDLDDADGALHEFRRLIALAPSLPAGHLGLGRALARTGERREASKELALARVGFVELAERARHKPDDEPEGADEALLTALEIAVEEHGLDLDDWAPPVFDLALFAWAEDTRLFDAEDGSDTDDWERYGSLRVVIDGLNGGLEAALAVAERIADRAPLPEPRRRHLRSIAYEEAQRWSEAAAQALAATSDLDRSFVAEEVLRAISLLARAGDAAHARELLERLRARLETDRESADEAGQTRIDELLESASASLAGVDPLVPLGVRGK